MLDILKDIALICGDKYVEPEVKGRDYFWHSGSSQLDLWTDRDGSRGWLYSCNINPENGDANFIGTDFDRSHAELFAVIIIGMYSLPRRQTQLEILCCKS